VSFFGKPIGSTTEIEFDHDEGHGRLF
jgi:hypothetical protein